AAGATVRVVPTENRVLASKLAEVAATARIQPTGADGEPLPIARGNLIRAVMFRDAMASKESAPNSTPLRHLDLSGQLVLERPMPAAGLTGQPAAPRLGRIRRPEYIAQDP